MVILLFEYKNETNQNGPTLTDSCLGTVLVQIPTLTVPIHTSIRLNPTNDPRVLS